MRIGEPSGGERDRVFKNHKKKSRPVDKEFSSSSRGKIGMPAFNQTVYNRMAKRGADMTSQRSLRRLGNRSFQANQGTLGKGQWQNKDAMRGQWGDNPQGGAGRPNVGGPPQGGGGRHPSSGNYSYNEDNPTFLAKSATTPKWKQQRQNAAQYNQPQQAAANPFMPGGQGGQGGKQDIFGGQGQ